MARRFYLVCLYALVAASLGWPGTSLALDAKRPLAEFTIQNWTRSDGLPHGLIIDLEQSSDGYIWAATWRGAARFNGRDFEIFDETRLPWNEDGSAFRLSRARDGSLLLGSQRYGLSRWRDGAWSRAWKPVEDELLLAATEDSQGRVWIGTREGLIRVDAAGARRFSVDDGMPDGTTLSLSADTDGVVWAGTTEGVARIEGDSVTAFGTLQGLPPGEIGALLVAPDGVVRAGSKRGAFRLEGDRFVPVAPGLPVDEVSALLVDRAGSLWIGTVGNGVYRLTERGWEHLGVVQGLPGAQVNALLEDAQGNLWIGTHGGLSQLRETSLATYSRAEGLADNFVRSMTEAHDGGMWIATNGGLSRIRDGRINALDAPPEANVSSLSLLMRENGELWVGTYRDGVQIVGRDGLRTLQRADGLAGEEVRAMIESRSGSVWLGTASGLTRVRGSETQSWARIDDEPNQLYVRALLESADGSIYIGTPEGLARWAGETLQRVPLPEGQTANLFGLHECSHGHLWLMGSGGLWRLRDGVFDRLDRRHELGRFTIFGMVADGQGNDWFSTARGLITLPHADLEQAVVDPDHALGSTRYADGAGSEGFSLNGGSMPSIVRAGDGRIWLATGQGAVVVDPESAALSLASPPTVIERVLVDGAVREGDSAVDLAAGTRRVEFHYAGLSFLARDALRYRYRLKGFDPSWVNAGVSTNVSYANLQPGDYEFEVQSIVTGAVDAPRSDAHTFRIRPYLHQTTGFRAAVVLLASLAVIWGFRWRTFALRRRAAELQLLVDERTHELQERGNRLEQADHEKAQLIAKLEVQSRQLARRAREDGLTGLANRRELDRALQAALDAARDSERPVALALIDIDRFKSINDSFGHGVGDDVLRDVAKTIRSHVEPPMMAGRYGGEEFALVLPDLSLEAAHALCESLRQRVESEGLAQERREIGLTVSIGVAAVAGFLVPAAYAAADRCLYEAKRSGRNRVIS